MRESLSLRERYRALVSLLIIPLGLIIVVRASMAGIQAWALILMGLAFVALGVVRLRACMMNVNSQKRESPPVHSRAIHRARSAPEAATQRDESHGYARKGRRHVEAEREGRIC